MKEQLNLYLSLSGLILAEMLSFASRRSEDDERYKNEIEDLAAGLAKINATKVAFLENLCVQLIVKQGQVGLWVFDTVHDGHDVCC